MAIVEENENLILVVIISRPTQAYELPTSLLYGEARVSYYCARNSR